MAETSASGVLIEFDRNGDGEPVLLCMPGWCDNRTVFQPLVGKLAGEVLTLDWRGHGGSEKPSVDFGLEEQVADAMAVIAASGVERIIPITMAHAGWVAIELRRRLGARVAGLVLLEWIVLDPPPQFIAALEAMQRDTGYAEARQAIFSLWTQGVDNGRVEDHVYREMGNYSFEMWSRASREIAAAYQREGSPLRALASLLPPVEVLHLYAQPEDPGYLAAQAEFSLANRWFRPEKLGARSHFPMYEVPDEMAEEINHFAASLVSRRSIRQHPAQGNAYRRRGEL